MKGYELVAKTIRGENDTGRTPLYGWVSANLDKPITEKFGSVQAFEDLYEFDAAHLFGGPGSLNMGEYDKIRESGEELTPDVILDIPLCPVDRMEDYQGLKESLRFYREERGRFCYVQTPGFFEHFNGVFGIENHLCYLLMYPDEIAELYRRQAEWTVQFAQNVLELGADMVHISDDWGSQRELMFSPRLWQELIYPNLKRVSEAVKSAGGFLSLHSDGCITQVLDGVGDVGFDVLHPWQETAGMSYDLYLQKYQNYFGILGGLCVQSVIGFGDYARLEHEIRRVFSLLKGKRWIFCTTHFVQDHCSIEELVFAYDLARKLAR